MLALAIAGFSSALGADPLVYSGDESAALSHVSTATGRPPEAFESVPWSDLRALPPTMLDGGSVRSCAGAVTATNELLEWAVQRTAGAISYGELDRARTDVEETRRTIDCLSLPPAPDLLARFHALDGLVAAGEGRDVDAIRAFQTANALKPGGLPWDDLWPPSARPLFDTAAEAPASKSAFTVIAPNVESVTLDGRPIATQTPIDVFPGPHLLLFSGSTPVPLTVDTPDGSAKLVVPSRFPEDLLGASASPALREAMGALLAARFGEGTPALIATEDGVWAATAGRSDWIELWRKHPAPARVAGRWAAAIGIGAAVVGGLGATLSYARAADAATDIGNADSEDSFLDADRRYTRSAGALRASYFAGGAGLSLAGVGIVLMWTAPE